MAAKPIGWRKEPARHALASKGIRTKPIHSRMAELGLKRSGHSWGRGSKPIMTLDANPSLEDIYGPLAEHFDEMKFSQRELMEEYANQWGANLDLITNPRDKEKFMQDFYYAHMEWWSDDARSHWEDESEYLKNLLTASGFSDGDRLQVVASPGGWTGQTGIREFDWNGDMDKFIQGSFGALDRDFRAEVNAVGKHELEATVYCHDIPTGSFVRIRKVESVED